MEAQTPAEGILKRNDWGDAKWYQVPCECGCDNHHEVEVEADDCDITVTVHTKVKTNVWTWGGLKTRVAQTWTLWTRGYLEYEASICLGQQQALNYAETLKSAMKDVEEFRKQRTKND